MDLEKLIKLFIEIKKEQIYFADSMYTMIYFKQINQYELLGIYRNYKKIEQKLDKVKKDIFNILKETDMNTNLNAYKPIIEIDMSNDPTFFLESNNLLYKIPLLYSLRINPETLKYTYTFNDLYNFVHNGKINRINTDVINKAQELLNKPIYYFIRYDGYYEDFVENQTYGVYKMPFNYYNKYSIREEKMDEFEKNKIIIRAKEHVSSLKIENIFVEEIMNLENKTFEECANKTIYRIKKLNYYRSTKYKEKLLLRKLDQLSNKMMAKNIKSELIFNGKFFKIVKERYTLLNNKIIENERIIKNNNKNSIIIIAITKDQKYIIILNNKIKAKIFAEFPFDYIEKNENILDAANQILKNKVGYTSDDLIAIDSTYTSPGIDNSTTHIVVAKNCEPIERSEILTYELFSESELQYLIDHKIFNGILNKLAYYAYHDSNNKSLSTKKLIKKDFKYRKNK